MGQVNSGLSINSAVFGLVNDGGVLQPAANTAGIASSKVNMRKSKGLGQPNTTITSAQQAIFIASASGTVRFIKALSIAACSGAATVTIDLYKNGSSILSSVITLNSSSIARTAQTTTIATTTFAAGDEFEVVVTATAGGGTLGTGLFVEVEFDENPS
jgi:hypothetical protein